MISVSNSLQREYPGKFCVVRRGALPLHQSISSQRNRRSQIRLHPVQTGTSGWFQCRPPVLPVVSIFSHSWSFVGDDVHPAGCHRRIKPERFISSMTWSWGLEFEIRTGWLQSESSLPENTYIKLFWVISHTILKNKTCQKCKKKKNLELFEQKV